MALTLLSLRCAIEMVEAMKEVTKLSTGQDLDVEERNLLSVAYKNVIGARRASWRIISSLEQKAIEQKKDKGGEVDMVKLTEEYKKEVEGELKEICNDVLSVIDDDLIPNAKEAEAKVFYYKM